jgi:hypothetical protein
MCLKSSELWHFQFYSAFRSSKILNYLTLPENVHVDVSFYQIVLLLPFYRLYGLNTHLYSGINYTGIIKQNEYNILLKPIYLNLLYKYIITCMRDYRRRLDW